MGLANNMDTPPPPPPVYNKRVSTAVPATLTPENNRVQQLTNIDLAMKLHYLRGVYFFKNEAVQGLDISSIKVSMFELLSLYYPAAGRIRRPEDGGGRPTIKCNDSGVRICEAESDKSVEEWMEMIKDDYELNSHLNYHHVLGPDLGFSPLVFLQFTWFKCGGMSVGLSWAHILGDVSSASGFINTWSQLIGGNNLPAQPPNYPYTERYKTPLISNNPFSLKRVDPVGDHWVISNDWKMVTHSFHFTSKQLQRVLFNTCGLGQNAQNGQNEIKPFEFMCAIFWKCLAKIRGKSEPKIVTICTNTSLRTEKYKIPNNSQVICTIDTSLVVANANISELAKLIGEKKVDEREIIEDLLKRDDENSDVIVYGANLTFVNLEDIGVYELELNGFKPIYANYTVDGVGDQGVVLILPNLENGKKSSDRGRIVTVILPEYEIVQLEHEMKEGGII